jgi:hypothetical protein
VYGFGLRATAAADFSAQVIKVSECSFLNCGVVSSGGAMAFLNGVAMTIAENETSGCPIAASFDNCSGVNLVGNDFEAGTYAHLVFANNCLGFTIEGNMFAACPATTFSQLSKSSFSHNTFYDWAVSFDSTCLDIDFGPYDSALSGALVGYTAWHPVTLTNSWAAVAGYVTPGYRMHTDGTVELRGVLHSGTPPSQAFVLPPKFRVEGINVIPSVSQTGVAGAIGLYASGQVYVLAMTGDISLCGIRVAVS